MMFFVFFVLGVGKACWKEPIFDEDDDEEDDDDDEDDDGGGHSTYTEVIIKESCGRRILWCGCK